MDDSSVSVMTRKTEAFESLLQESIVSSIRDLLGDSSMKAMAYHLDLDKVGGDPRTFHEGLYNLLNAPAVIIEEVIVKDLFRRLGLLYFPKGTFDFERYVNSAREVYSREKKRNE